MNCSNKILLIAPPLGGNGGVSKFCKMLYENLGPNFYIDYLEVGSLTGNRGSMKGLLHLMYTNFRLMLKLKSNDYKIVHLNPSFRLKSVLRDSLFLLMISQFYRTSKTVVFFHGWDQDLARRLINNRFLRSVFLKIYRRAGLIFVLHKKCKSQLTDIGLKPEKIEITTTTYEPITDIDREMFDTKGKLVRILFMSRLVEGKGADISVKVAEQLLDNGYKDFHLTIAGDGPLLHDLKKYIHEHSLKDYVDMPGYVKGEKKAALLRESDIFLLPTQLDEGCPVSLMEAMGAGLAIIGTSKGAIPEIVENGKEGFICDSQDPVRFYEFTRMLIDDRELLDKLQKSARKKAKENYELKIYMERMRKFYLSLIDSNT